MDYKFSEIEKKWQDYWDAKKTFKAEENSSKPKYYALDMFPYPSGSGLHVGTQKDTPPLILSLATKE